MANIPSKTTFSKPISTFPKQPTPAPTYTWQNLLEDLQKPSDEIKTTQDGIIDFMNQAFAAPASDAATAAWQAYNDLAIHKADNKQTFNNIVYFPSGLKTVDEDASFDISTIIQNLVDSLTNGGTIKIPKGHYKYGTTISFTHEGITITGDDFNNTILEYTGSDIAFKMGLLTENSQTYVYSQHIKNMTILCNANTKKAIKMFQPFASSVEDVMIKGLSASSEEGICVRGCINTILNRVKFSTCSGLPKGVLLELGYINTPSTTFTIRDSYIQSAVIAIEHSGGLDCKLEQCIIESSTLTGINVNNGYLICNGCYFENNKQDVYIGLYKAILQNCTFAYTSTGAIDYFFVGVNGDLTVKNSAFLASPFNVSQLLNSSSLGKAIFEDNYFKATPSNLSSRGKADKMTIRKNIARYVFEKTGVTSTTDEYITVSGSVMMEIIIPQSGHAIGFTVQTSAEVTAGKITIKPSNNGYGFDAYSYTDLTSGKNTSVWYDYLSYPVTKGDSLQCKITGGAGLTPDPINIRVEILIAY